MKLEITKLPTEEEAQMKRLEKKIDEIHSMLVSLVKSKLKKRVKKNPNGRQKLRS